jgi:hypothetical protein
VPTAPPTLILWARLPAGNWYLGVADAFGLEAVPAGEGERGAADGPGLVAVLARCCPPGPQAASAVSRMRAQAGPAAARAWRGGRARNGRRVIGTIHRILAREGSITPELTITVPLLSPPMEPEPKKF